jgi:hypothetical protein
MPPQLVALTEGPNILLDKPILLLGRHQECDIQLGSRKVSRRHCCVAQVNDYLVVRDLGSTNGIRINGTRVLEGSLKPGDELTIGNQRYQLQWAGRAGDPVVSGKSAPPARGQAEPPAPAGEDDKLESCESPIPLADPPGDEVPVGAAPPANHGFDMFFDPPPGILPDDLKLEPLSGESPPLQR